MFLEIKMSLRSKSNANRRPKWRKKFHQQVKKIITWLSSMGYFSSINSTKNVTKAVMGLPQHLPTSYYKSFDDTNFNKNSINLISIER